MAFGNTFGTHLTGHTSLTSPPTTPASGDSHVRPRATPTIRVPPPNRIDRKIWNACMHERARGHFNHKKYITCTPRRQGDRDNVIAVIKDTTGSDADPTTYIPDLKLREKTPADARDCSHTLLLIIQDSLLRTVAMRAQRADSGTVSANKSMLAEFPRPERGIRTTKRKYIMEDSDEDYEDEQEEEDSIPVVKLQRISSFSTTPTPTPPALTPSDTVQHELDIAESKLEIAKLKHDNISVKESRELGGKLLALSVAKFELDIVKVKLRMEDGREGDQGKRHELMIEEAKAQSALNDAVALLIG